MNDGNDYHLSVYAYTRKGDEIIPAAHEVAREQFSLATGSMTIQNRRQQSPPHSIRMETHGASIVKAM